MATNDRCDGHIAGAAVPPATTVWRYRVWFLAGVIALAQGARAWMLFGTPWVPGMNGGYYLVQARALLERGNLGIPDLPLTFYVQAGVARILQMVSGGPLSSCIVLAVKLCDALLPPLAALPVYWLVRRWSRRLGGGEVVPLLAAALAAGASPMLQMTGDFQKNALALVWLAMLTAALADWIEAPTRRAGLTLLLCLALLGVTHIGVFGGALVLCASVLTALTVTRGADQWPARLPWLLAGGAVMLCAALMVRAWFDPSRIQRLLAVVGGPPTGIDGDGPPMGGLHLLAMAAFAIPAVPALVVVWRCRRELPAAEAAVVAGCAAAALLLTGPWFGDKTMRLALIAFIPGVLAGAYTVLNLESQRLRRVAMVAACLLLLGGAVPMTLFGGLPVVEPEALAELASLKPLITNPERTLISAQHGTEWWTAWLLRTRISQARALKPADWSRYEQVYFIELKRDRRGPGGPPGFGPPPPGFAPPGPGFGPPPPGCGPPPMQAAPIPDDAVVVHDGPAVKLARVDQPPASLATISRAFCAR